MNRLDEMLRINRLSCKFEVIYPIRVPWHTNDVTFLRTFDEDMAWIVPWAESKLLKFTNISKFFKEIEVLRRAAVMVKKQQPLWGWHGMVSLFVFIAFWIATKRFQLFDFSGIAFVFLIRRIRQSISTNKFNMADACLLNQVIFGGRCFFFSFGLLDDTLAALENQHYCSLSE